MLPSKFISKKGELEKSPPFGKSFPGRSVRRTIPIKRWKNRYFILYTPQEEEACLCYFEDKESYERGDPVKGSGKILLSECVDLRKQSERLFGRDFLITLTTSKESKAHKGRVFHFKTRDSAEQDEWYDVLDRILRKREQEEQVETEINLENTPGKSYMPTRPTHLEVELEKINNKIKKEKTPVEDWEDSWTNRNSVASSGYASTYSRDSYASAFSRDSEFFRNARYSSDANILWSCQEDSNSPSRDSGHSGCSYFDESSEENKMMNSNQDLFSVTGFTGPRVGRLKSKSRSMCNLLSGDDIPIPDTYKVLSPRDICAGRTEDRQRTHSNNQKPFPVIKEADSDGLEVGGDKSAILSLVGRSQSDPVRTDSRK